MRALISVSHKEGVVEFAKGLQDLGVEIISTGGTAKLLSNNGVKVREMEDFTGFPEVLGGRVKSLHHKVHVSLLAKRDDKKHMKDVEENKIELIDIVAVNLYPFEETISKKDTTLPEAIEQIDIGGPTMLRGAAKNHKFITVVVDPNDYGLVLNELKNGKVSEETNARLAVKVFRHTADYDAMIDTYLSEKLAQEKILRLKYVDGEKLRYGENWHQEATFYKEEVAESCMANAKVLSGKEMSFNNYVDADAALESVKEFKVPAVSVVKHTNPCGLATGKTIFEALKYAWEGDVVSAFGSIIACTKNVDLETAEFLKDKFVEAVIAPGFDSDALSFLKEKSKNLRVIEVPELKGAEKTNVYRHVIGGMLEQTRDTADYEKWDCVTKTPFPKNKKLAEFAWLAAKHTKSNAIVIAHEYEDGKYMVIGMGAGQPNRIDALCKLSAVKAEENLERLYGKDKVKDKLAECVLASDAFFPFDDSVRAAHEIGVKYIVQPGGSIKDKEVIGAADELGLAMVFTGMRHFLH